MSDQNENQEKEVLEAQEVKEAVEVEAVEEAVKEAVEVEAVKEAVKEAVEVEAVEAVVEPEPQQTMADFEDALNASMRRIHVGDVLKGQVITVTSDELLVNIDYMSDGIIPATETLKSGDQQLSDLYQVGDQVYAEVLKKDDGEGNVLLSAKRAQQVLVWDELEKAFTEKTPIEVTVSEVVKGGVVCRIKGVRAFMPASLASAGYIEDLNTLVGQTYTVLVVDFDREKTKAILSRKELEKEALEKEKGSFFITVKPGDKMVGTVKKLMDYGAFVNVGPVDGLVRNQDLSWQHVKHPSEVIKEGDTVNVYVIGVDEKKARLSLGLKDVTADPFSQASTDFKAGQVYEGEVVKLESFGAFVRLAQGFEGLVHISQISEDHINRVEDVLEVGQKVQVKLLDIDTAAKRIRLSIKDAKAQAHQADMTDFAQSSEEATTNLKDVFASFLKDIES